MNAWLDHLLTDAERSAFDADGFLLVRDALGEPLRSEIESIVDEHDSEFRSTPGVGPFNVLNEHDLIGKEPRWLELLDLPATFPKVFGIMGWHIKLFHTQLLVTPPVGPAAQPGGYGWHQDNNRMNRDLETEIHPMISLKVGYFLTDVSAPGHGNLCVVPGSHRLTRGEFVVGRDGQPSGAIEVLANPGDAIVFDRRLWHSASSNRSARSRKFLTFGYSYRWLQPKSAMRHDDLLTMVDPVRRQLLGACTSANGYYDPQPEDVPLREWMEANLAAQTVPS
jgi:ectoine hydroxylase